MSATAKGSPHRAQPAARAEKAHDPDVSRPQTSHLAARVAIPFAVAVITFLAFYPALSAGFVNFDDGKLLQQNEGYQGLSSRHLEWMFTTTYMGHYQPLTWLSYALDFKLSGTDPHAYHRTNLILHALNAVLVYFLALKLMGVACAREKRDRPLVSARADARGSRVAASVAALLFAVHPLRVESVAWVSERRDVLSVFFLLAATLAFLNSVTPGESRLRSPLWYLASIGLLVLSLLAKAWGMSFFVIVTLLNLYPLGRLPWRIRSWLDKPYGPIWLQTMPYVVFGVIAALTAATAQNSAFETMKSLDEWSITDRIVQACYGLIFYVRKTIWPNDLAVLYPLPQNLNPLDTRYLLSIAAVVIAAAVLWFTRRRVPALFVAAIAYAVWLAPVLGFAQSGPQFVADRYSYVACIGWSVVIAGSLAWLWQRRPGAVLYCVSVIPVLAILVALFVATVEQTRVWQDSRTLWKHAVAVGADSTIAHRNVAVDLSGQGDLDGAIRHYRIALSLDPEDGSAWSLLANALRSQGRFTEAEEAYPRAIEHLVQKHLAWEDLGEMYFEDLNRLDDAIHAFREGIDYMQNLKTIRPAPAPHLYLYLGIALRARGDFANARPALEAATKFKNTEQRARDELRLLDGNP